MIKAAIIFDLDETLIVDELATDISLSEVANFVSIRYPIDTNQFTRAVKSISKSIWEESEHFHYFSSIGFSEIEGLWGDFGGAGEGVARIGPWLNTYRQKVWGESLNKFAINDLNFAQRIAEDFKVIRRRNRRNYSDAEIILSELHKQFRLGLITNGSTILQRQKITDSGLGRWFHTVQISGELGIGKPDKRIFQHTLESMGVKPENAVMVGDNPIRDIQGACEAGMLGILVDRKRSHRNLLKTDYPVVLELIDVPQLIQSLSIGT